MVQQIKYQDKPWLKNYDKDIPETIDYKEVYITDFLEKSAAKYPDRIALIFQGYEVTYKQLNEISNRIAACLHDLGIKKGDRVAIVLPNIIQCVAGYYGVLKAGAIVVLNNPLYTDNELEYQLNDSESKIVITLDLLANRLIDLRDKTSVKHIIYTSLGDYLPFTKKLFFPFIGKQKNLTADVKEADNTHNWNDILSKYQAKQPKVSIMFDDIAMLQYTGGTTGISKGVMLTHENVSKQIQQLKAWFPIFQEKNNERMLAALPFFHIFGSSTTMNFPIFMGATIILIPKPKPGILLEAIKQFKPTFAPLVPAMYIGMLDHPDIEQTDMTSIKGSFSGSSPLPLEIIKSFENKTNSVIVEGFGLSESSPVTHINPLEKGKQKQGSVGLPLPDTECRIVDLIDKTTDVPIGETGELIIKGPQIMKGYWKKPEATSKMLKEEWLHTGDIAKMDEDGYFYIVDRIKNMIISGGLNVYPRDIEEVLYENPKIKEACAIGISHPKKGEAIKAFVVLKDDETATQEELIEYCNKKLSKYKLPTQIEFRDELPKTNVGKVLIKQLRQEACSEE